MSALPVDQHALVSEEYLSQVHDLTIEVATDGPRPVGIEGLQPGCEIAVAGEWHLVCRVDVEKGELLLRQVVEKTAPTPLPFTYSPTIGETWLLAGQF